MTPTDPRELTATWTAAWEARDATALTRLFAADADYRSGLHGALNDLPRQLRIACRVWKQVRITLLQPWASTGVRQVGGAYRFDGTDRDDRTVTYEADVVLTFQARSGGGLEICGFNETVRAPAPEPPE